jgi:hypothetical protein
MSHLPSPKNAALNPLRKLFVRITSLETGIRSARSTPNRFSNELGLSEAFQTKTSVKVESEVLRLKFIKFI